MTILMGVGNDGMSFHTDSLIFDEARHWTWRAVRASLGTTTGLVLLAMLAKEPRNGPAVIGTADIMPDGNVVALTRVCSTGGGCANRRQRIGSIEAIRDNMRRLADHCKLSDTERLEMFEELRKWIRRDHRARSEN